LPSFSSLPLLSTAGPTTYSDDRNRVRNRVRIRIRISSRIRVQAGNSSYDSRYNNSRYNNRNNSSIRTYLRPYRTYAPYSRYLYIRRFLLLFLFWWGYSGHSARIDSLQRSSQRSARCTYSGHSTRLISAQGSRHIDRRAVLIAVIALDQSSQRNRHSDRRAVPIAVIAPDLDGRTKFIISFNFITSSIQLPLLPSILLQSSQNHHHPSDPGYQQTFNQLFTAFLFLHRPTKYLIRFHFSDAF
ncbi:hypothetical protein L249_4479, partial [Ophiocordyceps polyrhachis-furcata BCC 54312]